ncbi:hypothetical protein CmeUKMEL1_11910 [Cryptosporidium meleagridis]|uniref:Uncharacterized protein n=1 Tax=Cryptosporidium meleagridis TaxID=93969 RepID=A0A2P4Z2T2_9CRYT|nr:hypothetical protein CmeUKMEL1_11910 [Cryptosporidium meleagridis]
MSNNTFNEVPIRDTIKLLHDKLSMLFRLNFLESTEILIEIDESISKCDDYCISSCAEVIVPPVIMAIHNCIRNKFHPNNELSGSNHNKNLNAKSSLQLEELLKIFLNVLQKMNSKTSKIIFSRKSNAFFDILYLVTKVLRAFIYERNEFIIENSIKIAHLNFNIFWEYWEHKNTNEYTDQLLIIPVIIQFLLSIAIPVTNEFKYSKETQILALELLSEIPGIVENSDLLIKVYPGVIQKLSIQVINSIAKGSSKKIIELSLFAIIEWISNCLSNLNLEAKNIYSNMENIKNTAKILNYIIKFKTLELNLDFSNKDVNINHLNDNVCTLKVKSLFANITRMCLTDLFDIFYDGFDELLLTSLDFLVSLKSEDNYNNPLIDNVLNSISKNQCNRKMRLFFSNYSRKFAINFEQSNTEKFTLVELNEENNLIDFIRTLNLYIGFHKTENQFFKHIISTFCTEKAFNFFLIVLISNLSLTMYEKSINDLKKNVNFNFKNRSLNKENYILKAIDLTERTSNNIFQNYSYNIPNKNENIIANDKLEVFQLYGDLFTLTFFNIKRFGFEKSKVISSLFIKSISISILDLNHEKMEFKYILQCITQHFVKLKNSNEDEHNLLRNFILYILVCNATQLILNKSIFGNPLYNELPNFETKNLPNIIISWFNSAIEELNMGPIQQSLSNYTEINRNILLILLGNLLLIARNIGLDKEIFIKKLNKVITQLISLYGYGSPITKKIAAFILNQIFLMLGYSSYKFSISTIINEYSLEIVRSLEIMYYKGYSEEKVDLILTAIQHCKLELILELSDLIEKFNDINVNNNPWIFEFIAIITKRITNCILTYWDNFFFHKILKNTQISALKQKLESFQTFNTTIKEIYYDYFLDYITTKENGIFNFYPTQNFINSIESQNIDHLDFFEKNLMEEIDISNEISKIRKFIEIMINIIYPYTSESDERNFSIQDYQHLSTYSLLNCIFILSTETNCLFPYANMIIPGIINQWMALIGNIRSDNFDKSKIEAIKSREICQTNIIVIQLIISCAEFAIKVLEDKLIPFITEFIEFIFSSHEAIILMDDRESELNSEFQKMCLSTLEVLYYFTKFYLKLNASEIKFETLNRIVNLLISPVNSFISVKWRIVVSKTIFHIYFKFPCIINSKLIIQNENYDATCFKKIVKTIKLVENDLTSVFDNISIFSETRGELNLKLKINKF